MSTPKDRIEQAVVEVADPFAGEHTPETVTEVIEQEPQKEEAETAEVPMSKEDRQKALTEVYGEAIKWLREKHLSEFNTKRKELAAARGIEWSPKPTAAEKAEAEIAKLIEEHPALAKKFGVLGDGDKEQA